MFTLDSLRTDSFSWKAALSLADASKLSYENEVAVQNVVRNSWGFANCEFLDVGDTEGFVAQTNDVVLVVFRGTESLGDWLGNLNLAPVRQSYGSVHGGFFDGFKLVHAKITQAVPRGGAGTRRVWLTGHSLGGALATIAAAELKDHVHITGIHTCGQPRVGNRDFKRFMREHFAGRFSRFVNDDDLVTKVPPGYEHVGDLIHFDSHGNVARPALEAEAEAIEPPPLTEEEFRRMQAEIKQVQATLAQRGMPDQEAVFEASIEGLIPGLSDHGIDRYIAIMRRLADRPTRDAVVRIELEVRSDLETFETTAAPAPKRTSDPLPILLRVKDPNWKAPAGVKVNSQFGGIVSAQVSADLLPVLERDPSVISIESSREAGIFELATSLPFVGADKVHRPPIQEKGDAALVGIIDSGVDVLHEAFRDQQGKTRILAYWDQRDAAGPTPKEVDGRFTQDYGRLYLAAQIDRFIAEMGAPEALLDPDAHGTHVASIAAGRGVGELADGMAPEAKIIVVAPHMKTAPGDPPSLGYSSSHVDALAFLKTASMGGTAVLGSALPIAVNVSLGMNAGAHDGSSALEAAFDSITGGGRDAGYVIVKSAGNERGQRGHARIRAFNGLGTIQWDATATSEPRPQDYIEVWYSFLDQLEFTLVDPAGNRSATVSRANPTVTQTLNENSCHLGLTELHPDNGDNRLVVTITPQQGSIQTGRWTLEVLGKNIQSANGLVDAWVERERVRGVRFVNDEPRLTLSVPGTAKTVIAVGACNSASPLQIADFSSFGLSRDGQPKPDICAPGIRIVAAAAGEGDHRAVRPDGGTSMAAPHVTGALALALSRRHKRTGMRQYNAQQLRAALIRSAKNFSHVHHEGFGYGVLDVEGLLANLP